MILSLEEVSAGYGSAEVLRGISLTVAGGETVALVGANGAGKSTLLKTVSGLVRPRAGRMTFAGEPLEGIASPRRVARGIAHVPEGREIFDGLTVAENLQLGAHAVRTRDATRLERLLRRFPALRDRADRPAAELSGGQQQMLAMGRGLMAQPRLLLLDEPSLGLSPVLVDEIFAIVRELRGEGVAILIAEQNARMALAVADRGYVLENGTIVVHGTGAELLDSPQVAERYLGVGTNVMATRADAATDALSEQLRAILAS